MKKALVLSLLVLAICKDSSGQVKVGDVIINDLPDVKYIEVVITPGYSTKIVVAVDYGQQTEKRKDDMAFFVTGADKQQIVFKSNMDALNYMYKNGWELLNTYALFGTGVKSIFYVMKKKG